MTTETLKLYSKDSNHDEYYALEVAPEFVLSDLGDEIWLKAYFDLKSKRMIGYKQFNATSQNAENCVELGIWINYFFEPMTRAGNRNDTGRVALEAIEQSNEDVRLIPTEYSNSLATVAEIQTRQKFHSVFYAIQHNNGRMSALRCGTLSKCKAQTTWEGRISIYYQMSQNHLNRIVEIDAAIVELVAGLRPTKAARVEL